MAARINIKLGNLFDGPSDLIVLPCSTAGTVTGFVARTLKNYSIPHPQPGMKLGQVEFMLFEGGENIAQFVAYACSVDAMTSSKNAIIEIGRTLSKFCMNESSVKSLSVPLLGAGAGGLKSEDVISSLKKGFTELAENSATMTIFVLSKEIFDRIRSNKQRLSNGFEKPIRTFISHTLISKEDEEWVKDLAIYLIDQNIQARLDKFHLRRGMDLPQWMCNELALADKVLVVCNEQYKLKADGRLGGVGWETMIIQGDLANQPPESTKYQVIVRSEKIEDGLPLYLKTKYAFHAPTNDLSDSIKEELIKELLNLPLDARLEEREFLF